MPTVSSLSKHTQIVSALLSVLRADLGTYDFSSDTEAVAIGRFHDPPYLPFIAIDPVSVEIEDDAAPLGQYECTATFFIECWTKITSDTPTSVYSLGSDLAHEVIGALNVAHNTSGAIKTQGVRRLTARSVEFLRTEQDAPHLGHARITLEITYITDAGF